MSNKIKTYNIFGIILLLGILADTLVYYSGPLKVVSEEYIYYIFAAQSTIAALSATLLTVIVNTLDSKYFGFSVKEITNFKNGHLKISNAIPIALVTILFSSFFLAYGMVNSLLAILISVIIYISLLCYYSWNIITDDEYCINIVKEQIKLIISENKNQNIKNLLERLFESTCSTSYAGGIKSLDSSLELIAETIKGIQEPSELYEFLDMLIKKAFKSVTDRIGFLPAIDKVLSLYSCVNKKYTNFDTREIILYPTNKVRFLNNFEIYSSGLIEMSNGLGNVNTLEDSDKESIIYFYFLNVYENEILSKKVRRKIMNDVLTHLSTFSYSRFGDYDKVKQRALIKIIQKYVLLNSDVSEAEALFTTISKTLYSNGGSKNSKLYETIALIYLALYLYTEVERETITQNHREKLRNLMNIFEDDIHTVRISFKVVLNKYFSEVTKSLLNLSEETYTEYRFLEYFPPQFGAKAIVWDKNAGLTLAMYSFLLSEYVYREVPYKLINNWEERKDKIFYVFRMLNFFDPKSNKLQEIHIHKLEYFSNWIGRSGVLNEKNHKRIYEILNEEMHTLEFEKIKETMEPNITVDELNKLFIESLKNTNRSYGFNPQLSLAEVKDMYFQPIISEMEYFSNKSYVIDIVKHYFEIYLNDQVLESFPALKLSFDSKGVNDILEILKSKNFDSRNYTYFDDWMFETDIRESTNFRSIIDLINKTKMENIEPITAYMFFKEGCLDYNFNLTGYQEVDLSDEECFTYVDDFKIAEGLYKIRDSYYQINDAIETIKKTFKKVTMTFRFACNFSEDCGIRIEPLYKLTYD